jgi:hypothetical protein
MRYLLFFVLILISLFAIFQQRKSNAKFKRQAKELHVKDSINRVDYYLIDSGGHFYRRKRD